MCPCDPLRGSLCDYHRAIKEADRVALATDSSPTADSSPPSPAQRPGQTVDLDEVRRRVEALDEAERDDDGTYPTTDLRRRLRGELAAFVPALLADLDAAREELRRVEQERDAERNRVCEEIAKIIEQDAHATSHSRRRHARLARRYAITSEPEPDPPIIQGLDEPAYFCVRESDSTQPDTPAPGRSGEEKPSWWDWDPACATCGCRTHSCSADCDCCPEHSGLPVDGEEQTERAAESTPAGPAIDTGTGNPCTIYVPPEWCSDPANCRVHRGAYPDTPAPGRSGEFRQCADCGDDIWPGEPPGAVCAICQATSAVDGEEQK